MADFRVSSEQRRRLSILGFTILGLLRLSMITKGRYRVRPILVAHTAVPMAFPGCYISLYFRLYLVLVDRVSQMQYACRSVI